MYKHILIPTDGSELSMKAVEHGVLLARALKARVTSITVVSLSTLYEIEPASFTQLPEEWGYKKLAERFANKCLDQVKTAALAQDMSCDVMYVEHERPYQAIIDAANNQHCDLIVMASHGRHRDLRYCARQRDCQGPHPQHDPRPRLPLEATSISVLLGC